MSPSLLTSPVSRCHGGFRTKYARKDTSRDDLHVVFQHAFSAMCRAVAVAATMGFMCIHIYICVHVKHIAHYRRGDGYRIHMKPIAHMKHIAYRAHISLSQRYKGTGETGLCERSMRCVSCVYVYIFACIWVCIYAYVYI